MSLRIRAAAQEYFEDCAHTRLIASTSGKGPLGEVAGEKCSNCWTYEVIRLSERSDDQAGPALYRGLKGVTIDLTAGMHSSHIVKLASTRAARSSETSQQSAFTVTSVAQRDRMVAPCLDHASLPEPPGGENEPR